MSRRWRSLFLLLLVVWAATPSAAVITDDGTTTTVTATTLSVTGVATLGSGAIVGSGPALTDFGAVHLHGNSTATDLSVNDQYEPVNTNSTATAEGDLRNLSLVANTFLGLQLDSAQERTCLITASISSQTTAGAGNEYKFALALNGTEDAGTVQHRTLANNNDDGNLSLVWVVTLQPGDQVSIEVAGVGHFVDIVITEAYLSVITFQ